MSLVSKYICGIYCTKQASQQLWTLKTAMNQSKAGIALVTMYARYRDSDH